MSIYNTIKLKVFSFVLGDWKDKFLKPAVKKVLEFLDGKKTYLSIIVYLLTIVISKAPDASVSMLIAEIVKYISTEFQITPLDISTMSAAALYALAIGLYDKIKKFADGGSK